MKFRALLPVLVAALGLAGAASVAAFLYRAAVSAVDTSLEARLASAGESAAALLPPDAPPATLAAVMRANALDGAYLVGADRAPRADARGEGPTRLDLLRTDVARLDAALAGRSSVSLDYALGSLPVLAGYFPVRREGQVEAVLVLEAGESFVAPLRELERALAIGLVLAAVSAAALALTAARHQRAEAARERASLQASRAEALARLAAVAAHEIRNPLSIIQGTVELFRERAGATLDARGQEALGDIIGEVTRLRVLTEELMDLSAQRPLALEPLALDALAREVGRGVESSHPGVQVAVVAEAPLPAVSGDAARLKQVLLNLLTNAAQAQGPGTVTVRLAAGPGQLVTRVEDEGPGVAPELRDVLFEPFVTTRSRGTGLGLAVSRRLVEQHGGTLALMPSAKGAVFELRLPVREGGTT